MKEIVLYVICCLAASMALECGFSNFNKDDIKQNIMLCVKNNQTLEQILDRTSSASYSESEEKSSEKSSEDLTQSTTSTERSTSGRMKRATTTPLTDDKPSDAGKNETTKGTEGESSTEVSTTEGSITAADSALEQCVVYCVLQQLNMTDGEGLPDHSKFSEGLLKNASGRELRNFLQETTDECFQELEGERKQDPCEYSTKLLKCLAEKGKSNCADWPAGALPF